MRGLYRTMRSTLYCKTKYENLRSVGLIQNQRSNTRTVAQGQAGRCDPDLRVSLTSVTPDDDDDDDDDDDEGELCRGEEGSTRPFAPDRVGERKSFVGFFFLFFFIRTVLEYYSKSPRAQPLSTMYHS